MPMKAWLSREVSLTLGGVRPKMSVCSSPIGEAFAIRLLLIDADEVEAKALQDELGSLGDVELSWVRTYIDGIEMFGTNSYDLVLLDLDLPDVPGIEGLQGLRDAAGGVPVVVLSGSRDPALETAAVKAGAQDFVVKTPTYAEDVVRAARYALERHKRFELLERLSVMDELTHLRNRRGFELVAEQNFKLASRERRDMGILFIDLDNMKLINDRYGHRQGDQALQDIANILEATFRQSDVVARLSGDEFCVLLTGQPVDEEQSATRLRRNVAKFNELKRRPFQLSLSIGHSRYRAVENRSLQDLLADADANMYADKNNRTRRAKLLIVDDEFDILQLHKFNLEQYYDIRTAETGLAAVDTAIEWAPDLILLDLNLPDITGADVVQRLRQDPVGKNIPIIMVTAVNSQLTEAELLRQGADDYVTKPFDDDVLVARIERVLDRSARVR